MFKLRTLKIHKFRNVIPGSTMDFGDGVVAILGKNATGKTTLLNLLGAIWAWDFSPYAGEAIHVSYSFEVRLDDGEVGLIEFDVKNEPEQGSGLSGPGPASILGFPPRVSDARELCQIAVRFPASSQDTLLSLKIDEGRVESLVLGSASPERKRLRASMFAFLAQNSSAYFKHPADIIREAWSEQSKDHRRVIRTVIPDTFLLRMNLVASLRYSEDLAWLHEWRQRHGVFEFKKHASWLAPGLGFEAVTGESAHALKAQVNEMHYLSKDLRALGLIRSVLELSEVELRLDRVADDSGGTQYTHAGIFITKRDGRRLRLDQLSFGQQRLFGLLWYLTLLPEVAIVDEPANGLHYDWVALVLKTIGDRQAFLAMQDPLVLDHLRFADAEAVRRTFVTCTAETQENGEERWQWTNFSPDAATDVFESWRVGIQHVNEILRTRGLW